MDFGVEESKDSFEFSVVCMLLSTKFLDVLMCQLLRSVFFNRAGKLLAGRGAAPRNNFVFSLWRAPQQCLLTKGNKTNSQGLFFFFWSNSLTCGGNIRNKYPLSQKLGVLDEGQDRYVENKELFWVSSGSNLTTRGPFRLILFNLPTILKFW